MTNLVALPAGTELVGDYRIERVLGAGGFGITYLADEIALARPVTIKEYFPSDFAARAAGSEAAPRSQDCAGDYRWGLDRFIEEAQTLARFSHPHIVRVYRYFRANNTGYMVLHFEEGQSLKNWIKGLGRLPRQKELDDVVSPLLDALELIHKADFLHRDIAPDNIIIRKSGDPVLIDFGSARGEIASHSKTVSALVKPGYSPYEQYAETSRQQGPWTDIYALGATLYHAVTGKRPADAPSRMVKDELVPAREVALSSYRPGFLKAIDHALMLNIEARPQSIAAWRGELLAPEPAKPGWFTRMRERKQRAEGDVLAGAGAQSPAAAGAPPGTIPPPPDAPGPQGRMLDFVDGLKGKKGESAPIAVPAAEAGKAEPAKPRAAETVKIEAPPPAPAILKKKASRKRAEPRKPALKRQAEPAQKTPAPPRPRPLRAQGGRRMRPLVFKLLIGAGIASAAVAMQDRLPRMESRGVSVPSNQVSPPTTMVTQLKGHQGAVNVVTFTEDDRYILSAGADATLKVWNAGTGGLIRTIELDNGAATTLATSGPRALTGHGEGQVVLWNIETAEKTAVFKRSDASIWSTVFAGTTGRFAASGQDWKVALWDAANRTEPLHVFEGHEGPAQALAYTPRRQLLASGGADKTVKLWRIETLDQARTYRGHSDAVTALDFSPNGRILAAGGMDGSVRLWSTSSSRLFRVLKGHRGGVTSIAFSPSGNLLATAGNDGLVRLWDFRRATTAQLFIAHAGAVKSVAFSRDGERLAAACDDGSVRLWSVQPFSGGGTRQADQPRGDIVSR